MMVQIGGSPRKSRMSGLGIIENGPEGMVRAEKSTDVHSKNLSFKLFFFVSSKGSQHKLTAKC